MRRYLLIGLIVSLPLALGLGVALLAERNIFPNYTFSGAFHMDLAALASRAGILLSLIAGGVVAVRRWAEKRLSQARVEEQQAEAEARQRFRRNLDHELKTPLTTILFDIENLRQRSDLTAEQNASLDRIAQQAQRLQKLNEGLRWLNRLEELTLEKARVNLPEVLEEATTLACTVPERRERSIALNIQQAPWPLSPVRGDPDLLLIAFRNLLDNALKFSGDKDRVEVRATDDGRYALVEVADTGPGIRPEELPYIFEELYRGKNARNTEGSGLGLALVKRIVALHSGKIEARSRTGQGTLITVQLPLSQET
jgi:two-component system OmpR family sensor kinase